MIVVLKRDPNEQQLNYLIEWFKSKNIQIHTSLGDSKMILGLVGDTAKLDVDLIAALESGKVSAYITDFPTDAVIGVEGVTALPHLGASTPESEDNCAVMAAEQIDLYLSTGSIKNSVNMPNVILPEISGTRHCIIHTPCDCIAGKIKELCGADCTTSTRGDYAYTVFDADKDYSAQVKEFKCVIRVRVI